ncbi:hypothetical protein ACGFX2_37245 [Streptomyces goshikiensis]|uniref:hypothetical protein n=1 Tax=Streptomyces goshikiensis TaxID=1942 RepID=UPI0037208DEE
MRQRQELSRKEREARQKELKKEADRQLQLLAKQEQARRAEEAERLRQQRAEEFRVYWDFDRRYGSCRSARRSGRMLDRAGSVLLGWGVGVGLREESAYGPFLGDGVGGFDQGQE